MTCSKEGKLHEKHRQRIKKRFLTEGLDSFAEHEVLELLLFYGVPQKDTNELAHELIQKYGSLANVFEADYEDLLECKGVGPNTASLITSIPQISRFYEMNMWRYRPVLDNTAIMAEYARSIFKGRIKEAFFLISLNARNQVNYVEMIGDGALGEVVVYPSLVVKSALRHKARSVVLTHNHPGGTLRPTASDIDLTKGIIKALDTIMVPVLDHIIIAGDSYMSFLERGLLQSGKETKETK